MSSSSEPFDPYYHWLGIPPEEQPADHYRLLGIQRFESNREVIQNAADRQMAHLRTFQSGPRATLSQKLLNEVAAARVCLLSPEKKAEYDARLRERVAAEPAATNAASLRRSKLERPVPPAVPPPSSPEPAPLAVTPVPKLGGRRVIRQRRSRWPLLLYALLGVLLVVGTVALIQFVSRSLWPTRPAQVSGRLVLNWPATERRGATLELDGEPVDLAAAVAVSPHSLEFDLAAGEHAYRITRPGNRAIEGQFELEPGGRVTLDVVLAPRSEDAALVLVWPDSARADTVLEIDGRVYDWDDPAIEATADRIRVKVSAGERSVRIMRGEDLLLQKLVTVGDTTAASLSVGDPVGQLTLRWDSANRAGVVLLRNAEEVDLQAATRSDDGATLCLELPAGRATLSVVRDGITLFSRQVSLRPGRESILDVDRLLTHSKPAVVLVWPACDRAGAMLEVDGQRLTLPAADETDAEELVLELEPGERTIRITAAGRVPFQRTVTVSEPEVRLEVALPDVTTTRLTPDQEQQMRERFVQAYEQYPEHERWKTTTDPQQKRRHLRELLDRLIAEAEQLPGASPEQLVALEQTYRVALEERELEAAHTATRRLRFHGCITDEDADSREASLWDLAVERMELDELIRFSKARSAEGRLPSSEQARRMGRRIMESPLVQSDYSALEGIVRELVEAQVLPPVVADGVWACVLEQAAAASADVPRLVELAERAVQHVRKLLDHQAEDPLGRAQALLDLANDCRRQVLADRQLSPDLRERMEILQGEVKDLTDEIAQCLRMLEARAAIAAGQGAPAQHRFLGLWLLQQGEYDAAGPHLLQSGDAALVVLGEPLSEDADEVARRADTAELESKKTKYSHEQQQALRFFAQYLRQSTQQDSNSTESAIGSGQDTSAAANVGRDRWTRLARNKWHRLLDVVTLDALRQAAEQASSGDWNVLDDGTLVCANPADARLALPVPISGSYAITYTCVWSRGGAVNVNLPLGDAHSVVFALGAFNNRYSGFELVDGFRVDREENLTRISRTRFRLTRDAPVRVEVHVQVIPTAQQSRQMRTATGGTDWARIRATLNGRPVAAADAVASRFAPLQSLSLAPNTLGFSTEAACSYRDIALMRK